MIEHVEIPSSAQFFLRNRRITAAVITRLFQQLRNAARRPSNDLFRSVREPVNGSVFSAICFSHERVPGFLDAGSNVFDRVHGFLMLVEHGDYVALFRTGLELPARFKTDNLGRADPARVENAIATANAIFERIRVKSTSTSKQVLRSKTFEAANLQNSMPMASASRYFTQAYSLRRGAEHFSATPSTGRISQRGDRGNCALAVTWAATVIDQLMQGAADVSPFIRNFARRLSLDKLPPDVAPVLFAVDVPELTERLLAEEPSIRLVRSDPATSALTELNAADVQQALAVLDEALTVRPGRPDYRIKRGANSVGTLRIGKTRIALRKLDLPNLDHVAVEASTLPVGEDPDRMTLQRYIDREDLFTILFSEPTLAYLDGQLLRDDALRDGGANFLAHLISVDALAHATSEKGDFAAGQAEFSVHSVFRVIADDIAEHDDILVCDDLGDEWADFIGINSQARPASINFYHGKHGARTLGASAFHVSVSQAEKNLGRMMLAPDAMPAKYAGWSQRYANGGVQTDIPRVIRGGAINEVEQRIDEIRIAPDVVRHVYIVTSSLSKADVQAAFDSVAQGGRPTAHFVQLYWLLSAYFAACSEMGVVGFVMCQP